MRVNMVTLAKPFISYTLNLCSIELSKSKSLNCVPQTIYCVAQANNLHLYSFALHIFYSTFLAENMQKIFTTFTSWIWYNVAFSETKYRRVARRAFKNSYIHY